MSDPTLPPSDPPRPPMADYYASPMPPAPVTDPNARTWGMVGHLSALAMFVLPSFGNIVGPLVVWLVKKDEIPFAGDQAKEALNFNITWSIVLWLSAFTFCIGIGFVLVPLIILFMIVITIVAAMRANAGEWYRYPATLRLVK